MPKAARRRIVGAIALAAALAVQWPAAAKADGALMITTNTSDFLPYNRVVLSTVNEEPRAGAKVRLANVGSTALTVRGLTLGPSGEVVNAVRDREQDYSRQADFEISDAPRLPFRIGANRSVDLTVSFKPKRVARKPDGRRIETVDGSSFATLTVATDDPGNPEARIGLAGLNSADYRGGDEPSVAEIARAFGFTTDFGTERRRLGDTNETVGEEVYSRNWVAIARDRPVRLWPLALYSGPTAGTHDTAVLRGTSGRNCGRRVLYDFPGGPFPAGGENQKLLPRINDAGVTRPATVDDVDELISCPFSIFHAGGNSNDNLNDGAARNMRIFPVRDLHGDVVPNTWLVASDPTPITGRAKNYDYQDGVFLLTAARPE